jgi:RNA polymerase II-associated factor 1
MEDPRLDSAVLRPMQSHGDHFLAYYLTKDDEAAAAFKRKRTDGRPAEEEEEVKDNYVWNIPS